MTRILIDSSIRQSEVNGIPIRHTSFEKEDLKKKKILILGIGNTILRDDGAGIIVARKVYERFLCIDFCGCIELMESTYAPWRIFDFIERYNKIIIIDSIFGGPVRIGECLKIDNKNEAHFDSSHGIGLCESLKLAEAMGMSMPEEISIYAVNVKNPFEFGEALSEEVSNNIPNVVEQIFAEEEKYFFCS